MLERLRESWGDIVDVNEFNYDEPGFGSVFGVANPYSKIYDRADGRYMPVYQNETDLRLIRGLAWMITERVPMAQAWCNRLVDYTIGTGFDWTISHSNKEFQAYLRKWVDESLDCSSWASDLERETYAREIVDGEWIAELIYQDGLVHIVTREPDELTEPMNTSQLDDWLQLDAYVPSWSFGVLSRESAPEIACGYHFVRNDSGTDWDYVPASRGIHWKRNVRTKAKRGVSDFYKPHLYLIRTNRIATNTAEGTATQAAIAYIVEHPPNGTKSGAEAIQAKFAALSGRTNPLTGEQPRRRQMAANTRIDVPNGAKYQAGLLGSNSSNIYVEVMDALLRMCGTVHAFPEGMLTGSYANNNLASSLTAESPFVQGRISEQFQRASRKKRMIHQMICLAADEGRFQKFGVCCADDLGDVEVDITPAKVFPRNVLELTTALEKQKANGWVSDKGAITELGRDYEAVAAEMKVQGMKPGDAPKAAGAAEGAAPGGVPGSSPAGQPGGAADGGEWMGLSRLQWQRNRKAITDILNELTAGKMQRSTAKVLLRGLAIPQESIAMLLTDASDGKMDTPMPEGFEWVGNLRESFRNRKSVKKKLRARESFRSHLFESVAFFDPTKHPRGKDGKFIDSGMSAVVSKWAAHNTAAMSAKKKIHQMEVFAATDQWDKLEACYTAPVGKKLNSYQAGMAQAKANLLKLKAKHVSTPPKGSTPIPNSAAVVGFTKMPSAQQLSFSSTDKVGEKLGTEKAGTYLGPDGAKYYVKTPDNPNRTKNEVLASKLYQLAGGTCLNSDLVVVDGSLGCAAKWEQSSKVDWSLPENKKEAAKDFAVHALLGNWDAIGAGSENPMDNIRKINGKLTLVDAGGALEYSGMGGSGKKPFTDTADEWDSMRNPKINPTCAKVFGSMTPEQLIEAGDKLQTINWHAVNEAVDKYHPGTEVEKAKFLVTLNKRKEAIDARVNQIKADMAWVKNKDAAGAVVSSQPVEASKVNVTVPAKEVEDPVVIAAGNPGKPGETIPSKPAAKTPMTIPPPPFTQSATNQSANKKLQELYDAAKTGDKKNVLWIKTNPNAVQTYAQKHHKYKLAVLAAMDSGGNVDPGHAVAPPVSKPAAPAAAPAKVPVGNVNLVKAIQKEYIPAFPVSSSKYHEKNKRDASDLADYAIMGNMPPIVMASVVHPAPPVKAYAEKLIAMLEDPNQSYKQVKPAPAAKVATPSVPGPVYSVAPGTSVDAAKMKLASNVGVKKAAAEKVGFWSVHGEVDMFSPMKPEINWNPAGDAAQWALGKKTFNALPADQKAAIYSFTGGGYHAIAYTFRNDANPGVIKNINKVPEKAINGCKGMKAAAVLLPEGQALSRKYSLNNIADLHSLKPGQVISDPSMLSTSTNPNIWNGNVHVRMRVGPGVKALPIGNASSSPGEYEVTLSPNQRMLVTHVEHGGMGKKSIVHAILLPTTDDQYDVAIADIKATS